MFGLKAKRIKTLEKMLESLKDTNANLRLNITSNEKRIEHYKNVASELGRKCNELREKIADYAGLDLTKKEIKILRARHEGDYIYTVDYGELCEQ